MLYRLVFGLALLFAALVVEAEWTPPTNPNPEEILSEARQDRISGDYDTALAKHVWFHENALSHRPSLAGVRLSFALSDWLRLAKVYPPAMDLLIKVRAEAEQSVRDDRDVYARFHDFASINRTVSETHRTVELFEWLDENNANLAKRVYPLVEEELIDAGKFRLCGKYLDPKSTMESLEAAYRELASSSGSDDRYLRSYEPLFVRSVWNLVALLVVNDRRDEAEKVATRAKLFFDTPALNAALLEASRGRFAE